MINPEPEESIVVRINDESSSPPSPVDNMVSWETRVKEILDPEGIYFEFWNKIFVISCVIGVLSDPLFFYIPIINEKNKCVGIDRKLRMAAIALRLLTDVPFIIRLIYKIRDRTKIMASEVPKTLSSSQSGRIVYMAIAGRMRWLSLPIITHFLAIFPMPQLAILVVFYHLEDPAYRTKRKILNVFLLLQYIPNVYRLHLSIRQLQLTKRWVKAAFNFFMYVLASHVLGGFWYFFSIQRVTSCWHKACKKVEGCVVSHCDDRTSVNITFFNEFCPINPPNAKPFDFGMFLDALQSNITGSTNFPKKFLYSFWWGIRNLSSLGQNLETSSYEWENCFAILISVSGLQLFLYLIGNVQAYMQFTITKSEEIKDEEFRTKITRKETDIERWVLAHDFPEDTKTRIMNNIRLEKLVEKNIDQDVDINYLLSILSWNNRTSIKHHLCMNMLKKVPMLKCMDVRLLEIICKHLRPVIYIKDSYVARAEQPLDLMLFVIEGTVQTYTTDLQMVTSSLKKGDFYGEKLLSQASPNNISDENVICTTKVEAFALMAEDLGIVSKFNFWNLNIFNNSNKLEMADVLT